MRYSGRDILALTGTPVGRATLLQSANRACWPVLQQLAAFHRRTFVRRCRFAAIVGSFGKTTTTRAVAAALGTPMRSRRHANCWSHLAEAVLGVQPGQRHAVIEAGISDTGQMAAYARLIRPDIAVVTCIGSEHHRSLGTLETTRAEKSLMVGALPSRGVAVLNGDDPNVVWMAGRTRARVVTFGLGEQNDVRASEIKLDWPRGTRFCLHAAGREFAARTRLFGRHMAYPVLAAVATALAEGICLEGALERLEKVEPTPGRMQPIRLANGAFLLRDDFKSSYETIETAFDAFAEIPARRRIVVLGDVSEPPGKQGPIYRHFGERIARTASKAVLVTRNYQWYTAGAVRAGMPRQALVGVGKSAVRAAEAVQGDLGPGDVVLIKGRDTQRLSRVALALQGRIVRCDIMPCRVDRMPCERCPMLEQGWNGMRVVT